MADLVIRPSIVECLMKVSVRDGVQVRGLIWLHVHIVHLVGNGRRGWWPRLWPNMTHMVGWFILLGGCGRRGWWPP